MKKKVYALFIFSLIFAMCISTSYAQIYNISPGIEIIKESCEIKKCGVINTPVQFAEGDFDPVLGKPEYITFTSVPNKAAGSLYLGGKTIKEGQTVSRSSLKGICFIPFTDTAGEVCFSVCDAANPNAKYGVCTVYVLESINLAPTPSDCSFDTLENITHKGYLAAKDPEGDEFFYSVSSLPKHGTLQLVDTSSGLFMYTPKKDFTGRDIFKFRVTDKYGNRSQSHKVTVHVNQSQTPSVFNDMTNHWAHASAIRISGEGILGGKIVDGKLCFCPDDDVTRGDFVAIALIAAGFEEQLTKYASTSFYDDSNIPHNIRSYAAFAEKSGFVNGYPEKDGTVFGSERTITRAEAATIISRMLFPESTDGIKAVTDTKIMSGTSPGNFDKTANITRAQLAKIYCNIKEYCKNLEK